MSMQFRISTTVPGHFKTVYKRFDQDLFEFLLPASGSIELVEFTGSKKGDFVQLEFKRPISGTWVSEIIEDNVTSSSAYFIDKGTTLPFGLRHWIHKHEVRKVSEETSTIDDIIQFGFGNGIVNALMFPAVYLNFRLRKKLYRKYFGS